MLRKTIQKMCVFEIVHKKYPRLFAVLRIPTYKYTCKFHYLPLQPPPFLKRTPSIEPVWYSGGKAQCIW